jgi:aerobic-type carbon monoxide dehydrogenase small subunit (CoxS/CutS family)
VAQPEPTVRVDVTINGERHALDVAPAARMLDVLREQLGLTGTKEGCGEGECGACTVLMDGLPVNSCLVPAFQAHGRDVETIESVTPEHLTPLLVHGATQCGACTPGVVMTGEWVSRNRALLERFSLRALMAGNFCRCTGYDGIIEGIEARLEGGEA